MRDSWIYYRSFYEAWLALSEEQRGKYYTIIFRYMFDFVKEESDDPIVNAMFKLIAPQIEANIRKYENWKKPKKKQEWSEEEAKSKQEWSEIEGNVNGNDDDNDNGNVNKKELFKEYRSLYPNKKWKAKAQEWYVKYIEKKENHLDIMNWLRWYIQDHEKNTRQWAFCPEYRQWDVFLNKKTWMDYSEQVIVQEKKLSSAEHNARVLASFE